MIMCGFRCEAMHCLDAIIDKTSDSSSSSPVVRYAEFMSS